VSVEREHPSSSATFNQAGLPAFLAAPVAPRAPGSTQARVDSSADESSLSGVQRKNFEMTASVGDVAPPPLSSMETSES
jgi:hypothetical protein